MSHKIMNCPHCGKILPKEFWHDREQVDKPAVKCGSQQVWKDAIRYVSY